VLPLPAKLATSRAVLVASHGMKTTLTNYPAWFLRF